MSNTTALSLCPGEKDASGVDGCVAGRSCAPFFLESTHTSIRARNCYELGFFYSFFLLTFYL